MHRNMTLIALGTLTLAVMPLVDGCCMPATQNPVAAASAGAKIYASVQAFQSVETDEDILDAVTDVAETVADLTTSEIASAINLLLGEDWSLEDAEAVKDLAEQFDEETISAFAEMDLDSLKETEDPNDVTQAIEDAGITLTEEQEQLIGEAVSGLQSFDPNSLTELVPGLEL